MMKKQKNINIIYGGRGTGKSLWLANKILHNSIYGMNGVSWEDELAKKRTLDRKRKLKIFLDAK